MAYPLPRHPGANGFPGPYFDGRHNHNLTNNPYLNTLFEYQNATEDMLDFAPIGGGYNANQAFLNDFLYPITDRAAGEYRAGMETAHGGGEGGGGGGGLLSFIGNTLGGIVKLPGQIVGAPFRMLGLGFVADIVEAPGNLVGGLVEGAGNLLSSIF